MPSLLLRLWIPRGELSSKIGYLQAPLTTLPHSCLSMHPALAVFDSGIDRLKLPIMQEIKIEDVPAGEERNFKRYPVSSIMHRYFDWIGEVEIGKSYRTLELHLIQSLRSGGE